MRELSLHIEFTLGVIHNINGGFWLVLPMDGVCQTTLKFLSLSLFIKILMLTPTNS